MSWLIPPRALRRAKDTNVFRLPGNLRRAALGIAGILATVTPALAQFETRDANAVPEFATSLAIGDFNRDGRLDIAVASAPELLPT